MKKYNLYFLLHALFVLCVLFLLGKAAWYNEYGFFVYGLYLMLYLGVVQLLTGLYLLAEQQHYPDWVKTGIRNYWLLNGGYVLLWLAQIKWLLIGDNMTWFWLWLVVLPLGIATYQFMLVYRMAGLRSRQLEKRNFLKIYQH